MTHDSTGQAGANRDGFEITPQMVEAGKEALISWFDGTADFGDGARLILEAGMLARAKMVEFNA